MGPRAAWALNLGAEAELEDFRKPFPLELQARLPSLASRLTSLFRQADVLLFGGPGEQDIAENLPGLSWMPTPTAIKWLERAGAKPVSAPSYEILRRVSDRRFSLGLGATLPGQRLVTTIDEALEALSTGGNWLLRRPFGFAGRGRRRARRDEVLGAARTWIEASLRSYGALCVEPWVERVADFGLHGYLSKAGALTLGSPTSQEMAPDGTWLATRPVLAGELNADEESALFQAAEDAARALFSAGYFGPFGLDAFRFREANGACRFNPRCEINARYSMGWSIGMGERRPDLENL